MFSALLSTSTLEVLRALNLHVYRPASQVNNPLLFSVRLPPFLKPLYNKTPLPLSDTVHLRTHDYSTTDTCQ